MRESRRAKVGWPGQTDGTALHLVHASHPFVRIQKGRMAKGEKAETRAKSCQHEGQAGGPLHPAVSQQGEGRARVAMRKAEESRSSGRGAAIRASTTSTGHEGTTSSF